MALSIAFIRVLLKFVDGARPALADLRSTPATFFRFAIASLSYTLAGAGLLLVGSIAAVAIMMNFLDILSAHSRFSLPVSVGISALEAAAVRVLSHGAVADRPTVLRPPDCGRSGWVRNFIINPHDTAGFLETLRREAPALEQGYTPSR